jgi:Ca2+-binding RTX toxin-like protein
MTTEDNLGTNGIDLSGNELGQYLFGNAGDNVLDGKEGADVMLGLGGADSFAFTRPLDGSFDRIADFDGDDTILLEDAVFGLATGSLNPDVFVVGTAAGDADDRIIYDQSLGALYYDADGNGAGAAVLFAVLDNAPVLTASDFQVI